MKQRTSPVRSRRASRPLLAAALAVTLVSPAGAQSGSTGRVVGRVVDIQTGAGIAGVSLVITESGAAVLSGIDGRFAFPRTVSGLATIRADYLGYASKIVTDIAVPADAAVEVVIGLAPQALELDEITVSAAAERGSVSRALDAQRTATGIVSSVTAEQIARSPDGDAAAAMQRVSGVTVQDGKFIFVRGLGERYTTTSLNGARVPSPEPERKVVPLDMFPAGLLQTITTSKTFTPDQPGDFSGAQVNIETREFAADRQLSIALGGGFNTAVTGRLLPRAPTDGLDWLGFAGGARRLPAPVDAAGDFRNPPSQLEQNRMVDAFRNAWQPRATEGRPNGSFGASIGGTDPIFGRRISYLGSVTYSRSEEAKTDQVRAIALAGPGGTTDEIDRYTGTTGTASVLWGGLGQLATLLGEHSRIVLNTTYNRTSDNEARTELGTSENHGSMPLRIERLRYVERSVHSSQLKGEHQVGGRHAFDWAATFSGVERREPDRSEIVYAKQTDPATGELLPWAWFSGSNEGAVRTFSDLAENAFESAGNYRLDFGAAGRTHRLKLGGTFRSTDRDASSRVYSISGFGLSREERELAAEQLFDGRFTGPDANVFRVTPLSQGGSYTAEDRLLTGYGMLEVGITDRIRLIGGARVERSRMRVEAEPTIGAAVVTDTTYTDILPALALNVSLTDAMNLRLSASRTLARPEYRELAGIQFREVIGGEQILGNPELVRTRIINGDIRWEWYPNPGEIVSVALFSKSFEDPIERVYLATSGTRVVTFVNAEGAENYGVEFELRKRLGALSPALSPWTAFANATLMHSEIRIGSGAASRTNAERAMVGQAPWVVNAGLTFAPTGDATSATLLYNVVGRRIVNAAEAPLPDVYEEARHVLDLSLRVALTPAISAKLDVKNLLDEPFEQTQGSVTRELWRTGRSIGLGLSLRR